MTDEQYEELMAKMNLILGILLGPEECPHEHARDIGTMGQRPGEHMICEDCGEEFSRKE